MAIKAVFFDLGNVLLGFDWKSTGSKLSDRCGLAPSEIGARFSRSRFVEYELGHLTTTEFFGELGLSLGFEGELDELVLLCSDIFYPLEHNIALARDLRGQYRLGIISNTNEAHVRLMKGKYDFLDLFDAHVYSFEVNSRKPAREIFDLALDSLYVKPEESIFIDDLEENATAARDLGWHAIHLLPQTDLTLELQRCGVRPIMG